jgi:hypothetical protein
MLILSGVFRPVPGSLLFAPTSIFWRASSISALIETVAICCNLLLAALSGLLGREVQLPGWWSDDEYFPTAPEQEPDNFMMEAIAARKKRLGLWENVLNEALALTSVPLLNSKEEFRTTHKITVVVKKSFRERARICRELVKEKEERGTWVRFGIILPMVTQYVKLMVVRGRFLRCYFQRSLEQLLLCIGSVATCCFGLHARL